MKEGPIIFCTDMVKAVLDGRKWVTRRVIKPQPEVFDRAGVPDYSCMKSKYHKGDLLYVRETFAYYPDKNHVIYKAREGGELKEQGIDLSGCWKPSIHMPKKYAHIWLEVLDVRAERLQDITEADAIAEGLDTEGCCLCPPEKAKGVRFCLNCNERLWDFVEKFQELWDSLNYTRGYGWDTNPWVWRIEFKKINK